MKKYLFLLLTAFATMATFTACSSDDDDNSSFTLSQSEITLKVKTGTEKLTASTKGVNWSSERPFIAAVNNEGYVRAVHVGETNIIAKKDGHTQKCKVTVSPNYTTFAEPITEFGKSKEYIISKLGTPDRNEGETIVYGKSEDYQVTSYTFKNGKLDMCTVALRATDSRVIQLPMFFIERYEQKTSTIDGMVAYFNAPNEKEATMYVLFDPDYKYGHYWIYYTKK